MMRMSNKRYEQHVMLAMVVYMVLLFANGPLIRGVDSLPLKAVLALLPAVPVIYLIAVMGWRIRASDELEQRSQLIALGVASALVAVASLIGGFLAAAGVLHLGGDVLIWVFPLMMAGYGIGYRLVARQYGAGACYDEAGSAWLPWFFGATAVLMAALGFHLYARGALGSAVVMWATAVLFIALGVWIWRRRHTARDNA